jgi:queuine tRNA-ribosyltransferase
LFAADEMLACTLLSLHNVAFYCRLMAEIRQAVRGKRFAEFQAVSLARWGATL